MIEIKCYRVKKLDNFILVIVVLYLEKIQHKKRSFFFQETNFIQITTNDAWPKYKQNVFEKKNEHC